MKKTEKTKDTNQPSKKYGNPVLKVYGTIEKMTRNVQNGSGNADSHAGGNRKTA